MFVVCLLCLFGVCLLCFQDGSCLPDDVPCVVDVCWVLGSGVRGGGGMAFEMCGGVCVPIGLCDEEPPGCAAVLGFTNCSVRQP